MAKRKRDTYDWSAGRAAILLLVTSGAQDLNVTDQDIEQSGVAARLLLATITSSTSA